ncbi:hypothetical protein [Pseudarthrobacter sp. N5]|uniref:aggregation-promoting factor C-terminal-like domain-containing protein n=1 Tax=Pseudarthrobacter sp. N5 TaxID=3418416 RepID=UPI003CF42EE3
MSASKDQSRPVARHRGENAAPPAKSQSVLKNAASRINSQRMPVVAGIVATLLGAASLGQAAFQAVNAPELSRASSTSAAAPAAVASADAQAQAQAQASEAAALKKAAAEKTAAETSAAAKVAQDKAAADSAAAAQATAAEDSRKASEAAAAAAAAIPVAVDDPAAAKAYAASQLAAYGWGQDQMQALSTLWDKESGWKTTATNSSSGAYGIVQSLPGTKMASVGTDWESNYKTQIKWGLNYIKERYGSPSGALSFHYANNWY